MNKQELKDKLGEIWLRGIGCSNCVIRDEICCRKELEEGYCDMLLEFLLVLMNGKQDFSRIELEEMYQLYVLRKENNREYQEMLRLREDGGEEFKLNTMKMFWLKTTDMLLRGIDRIRVREQGTVDGVKIGVINLTQIHSIVNKYNDKRIEDNRE